MDQKTEMRNSETEYTNEETKAEEEPAGLSCVHFVNQLNHVELEYMIMTALESQLCDMSIERSFGDTVMSFPVNYLQRAKISIKIDDAVLCQECKSEIINPAYKQNTHKNC